MLSKSRKSLVVMLSNISQHSAAITMHSTCLLRATKTGTWRGKLDRTNNGKIFNYLGTKPATKSANSVYSGASS